MASTKTYIDKVSDFIIYLENLDNGFNLTRGQSRDLPLYPSALRKDSKGNKLYSNRTIKYLLKQFEINSYQFIDGNFSSDNELEWMTYAQHYGIPTNLLDFTMSPITSLFFAVENAFNDDSVLEESCGNKNDGVVYFLNTNKLNSKNINNNEISTNIEKENNGPYAIQARKLNNRVQAQKGAFVIFNDSNDSLDTIDDDTILRKIYIHSSYKKDLLATLFEMGIGYSNIYPELEYVAKDIVMRIKVSEYTKEDR